MKNIQFPFFCLLFLTFIGVFIIFPQRTFAIGNPYSDNYQLLISASTLTPTQKTLPTDLPLPTIVPSPTTALGSNIDAFEKVATQAIQASNNALEQMKWVIGITSTLVIAIAGIVGANFAKHQKDLMNYAMSIKQDLIAATQKLESAEREITNISESNRLLLIELHDQLVLFLPPEMAMKAFEQGKINHEQYRETQVWFAWAKWIYLESDEGYRQMEEFKKSPQGFPSSIKRIMIFEIERIGENAKTRGVILNKEETIRSKLLSLLDLAIVDASISKK